MNGIDKAYAAIEAEKLRHHIPDAENMVPSNHPESPDSSKPSWADAPEWANWLAQDEDGYGNWHETRPRCDGLKWRQSYGRVLRVGGWPAWNAPVEPPAHAPDWRETLEERPHE